MIYKFRGADSRCIMNMDVRLRDIIAKDWADCGNNQKISKR